MSQRLETNPFRWSPDIKALSQLVTLIVTIVGSAAGGAIYIGEQIYSFAETQTKMVQSQVIEAKAAAHEEGNVREKSITELRVVLAPRIEKLEDAVQKAETEASAARQRIDDMKEDLRQLKDLAQRNLTVTESHGADIRATRDAVAPKDDPGPPGR